MTASNPDNSAIERVLIEAIAREDHLHSDGKTVFNPPTHVIRAWDAALEYWLLKHKLEALEWGMKFEAARHVRYEVMEGFLDANR